MSLVPLLSRLDFPTSSSSHLRSPKLIVQLDLSISEGRLNMDRLYSVSGKIRVEYISSSGKTYAGVFQLYEFRGTSNGFRAPFL